MSMTAPSRPERRGDDPWTQEMVDRRRPRGATLRPMPPKGWYPDPPALRFWDGEAWTVLTRPAGPPLEAEQVAEDQLGAEVPASIEPVVAPTPMAATVPTEPPMAPVLTTVPPMAEPATEDRPQLRRELSMLLLVALLALGAGAVVAALGIFVTV